SIALNFLSSSGVAPKLSENSPELRSEEIADVAKSFVVRVLCVGTPMETPQATRKQSEPRAGDSALPVTSGYPCADSATKRSYWQHNGSILCLVAEGDSRSFFYDKPEAGVRKSDLLFSGRAVGLKYIGTAYLFKGRCGKFEYEVRGNILDNYR